MHFACQFLHRFLQPRRQCFARLTPTDQQASAQNTHTTRTLRCSATRLDCSLLRPIERSMVLDRRSAEHWLLAEPFAATARPREQEPVVVEAAALLQVSELVAAAFASAAFASVAFAPVAFELALAVALAVCV